MHVAVGLVVIGRISNGSHQPAEQDTSLQILDLEAAGCERIYRDSGVSGTRASRPELDRMLDRLSKGDEVVVWKLDRLGRNTRHLLELLDGFKAGGIKFRSLRDDITTDPDTEFGGAMAQAMVTIISAFAQLERDQLAERTRAVEGRHRASGKIRGEASVHQNLAGNFHVGAGAGHQPVKTRAADAFRQHRRGASGTQEHTVACLARRPDRAHVAFGNHAVVGAGAVHVEEDGADGGFDCFGRGGSDAWLNAHSSGSYRRGPVPPQGPGTPVAVMKRQTLESRHLGYRIPSPAILEKIGTAFRRSVNSFAEANHIPLIRFAKEDRKIDVMRRYIRVQERVGRSGVVAIGVAQEYQNVFASTQRQGTNGIPCFGFHKADRRVTCFYFYLWDTDFGPAFIKICAYFPYPIKVWINGHEWAKRQATHSAIAFTELSNGFAACEDPRALQEVCDRLGPGAIQIFFQRWPAVLPVPLTDHDADAGYWWELSMRQVEISRTLVFDAPRHARGFFEALVADNLDIGRPDSVELIFTGHAPHSRPGRPADPGLCKTKIVTRDTDVTVNAFYKHSRIKQYLKDGRALRIETGTDTE